ncbi:MAG: PAS-domain containing protein, partial [Alphaproteobacteria bacterium]
SFALEAARLFVGADALLLEPTPDARIAAISVGGRRIPTDGRGRVRTPFARMEFPIISAHRLLAGDADLSLINGRAVVIGVSAAGAAATANIGRGLRAPDHYLQAAAIGAILTGATGYQPEFIVVAEIAAAALAASLFLFAAAAGWRILAVVVLVGAPGAALWLSGARYSAEGLLIDPTLVAVVLAAAAIYWAGYMVVAQRLALLYERAFVGRVVTLMTEGLVITDRAGGVRSANPAAQKILSETPGIDLAAADAEPASAGAPSRRLIDPSSRGEHNGGPLIEVDSAPIADRGRPLFVHVLRDVTRLKRAEDAASLAAFRLSLAAESMADGLALFDSAGCVAFHNPAFAALAGIETGQDVVGASYADVTATAFRPPAASGGEEPREGGDGFAERLALLRTAPQLQDERETRGGRWLLVRERATPDGGLVAVYTDITSLKQVEADLREARRQSEAANEAKNRFLATVSHELRTPLNAIQGFADTIHAELFGPLDNPRYREYISYILASGAELLDLVEN